MVQLLGNEVQKSQDVMISVNALQKHEQAAAANPVVVLVSILGEDVPQVDAAETAMQEKVTAWSTE